MTLPEAWVKQKRIESLYKAESPFKATVIHRFLSERYPNVPKGLEEAIMEARLR